MPAERTPNEIIGRQNLETALDEILGLKNDGDNSRFEEKRNDARRKIIEAQEFFLPEDLTHESFSLIRKFLLVSEKHFGGADTNKTLEDLVKISEKIKGVIRRFVENTIFPTDDLEIPGWVGPNGKKYNFVVPRVEGDSIVVYCSNTPHLSEVGKNFKDKYNFIAKEYTIGPDLKVSNVKEIDLRKENDKKEGTKE